MTRNTHGVKAMLKHQEPSHRAGFFNGPNMRYLIPVLAALALSACTTTEFIHVTPQCTPPPSPALPELSKGELWDKLGDESYRQLERYINGLWAFSDEQASMLEVLCND